MKKRRSGRHQRGVTFIFLTLSVVALCAVAGLSVDEGLMWISRNRAQVVADAAALAAAKDLTTSTDPALVSADQAQARQDAQDIVNSYTAKGNLTIEFDPNTDVTFPTSYTPDCASGETCASTQVSGGGAQMIRVVVRVKAPSAFGGAIGQSGIWVPAHAEATAEGINTYNHLVPWGVVADNPNPNTGNATLDADLIWLYDIAHGITPPSGTPTASGVYQTQEITLKAITMNGSTIQSDGNFGAVDLLTSTGGNDYRTNIGYNSSQSITIGDSLNVLTGNKVGPTSQGISDRLSSTLNPPNSFDHTFTTYDDWFYGRSTDPTTGQPFAVLGTDPNTGHTIYADPMRQNPNDARLGVVPLITTPGKNGTATVTVIGFAVFFIEYQVSGNGQGVVTGRFVGMNLDGIGSSSAPLNNALTTYLVN